MSATTAAPAVPTPATHLSQLSFGGILRSEWIKLRSLRSTAWCYLIAIVVTVGLALLVAGLEGVPNGGLAGDAGRAAGVSAATVGVNFGELVVAVLGALMITGEYGTGMIRSTFAAVPKRIPALVGKILIFGVVTFVVGLVSVAISFASASLVLGSRGVHTDPGNIHVLLPLIGAAGYLALIGMMSLAIGAIIRSSAGGIAAALGLILVLPIILGILGELTHQNWVINIAQFLPSAAGGPLFAYTASGAQQVLPSGIIQLDALWGGLVLAGWVIVPFVLASVLVRTRDA
ncbi:MAG TPA: ABC transporter permease [Galbitalea sp.]|jgi:ABC-2 type transport system permease protein